MKIMNKRVLTASLLITATIVASFAAMNFRQVQSQPLGILEIYPSFQSVEPGATFYVDVRIED